MRKMLAVVVVALGVAGCSAGGEHVDRHDEACRQRVELERAISAGADDERVGQDLTYIASLLKGSDDEADERAGASMLAWLFDGRHVEARNVASLRCTGGELVP